MTYIWYKQYVVSSLQAERHSQCTYTVHQPQKDRKDVGVFCVKPPQYQRKWFPHHLPAQIYAVIVYDV